MSVVVPFPGSRVVRAGAPGRGQMTSLAARAGTLHTLRGGVISWMRAAECSCCGRPTLSARAGRDPLCVQCTPPSIA
jgi:hypothetical protein